MATTSAPPESSGGSSPTGTQRHSVAPRVFIPAAIVIVAFVIYGVALPKQAETLILAVQSAIVAGFSWYYVGLVSAFVVFAVWLGVGHFGDIKLGPDDEEPEFGVVAWLSMLFAAGMGIGLVYWGVAEPLRHLAEPKPGFDGTREEAGQQAMIQTFLHWGIHPWAIYVVIGLAIAYAVHRKGRPISIRWALEPLFGDRVKGWVGDLIDIVAIVGTLFGVATSLGLGVMQIGAGLGFTMGIEPSTMLYIILIGSITLLATLSVVTGVKRGIKWLSNLNMGLAGGMLLFVLLTGPTLFIAREFMQSIGLYVQNILSLSFDVTALQGGDGQTWQATWTSFYWGWWISWAPFVGVFIARISRGRTVRQFVGGVLLVPSVITFLWFSVFGGSGIYKQLFQNGNFIDRSQDPPVSTDGALFNLLEGLPGGFFVSILAIILITLFFVTSSDSGSLVVDMLASGGDPEPPTWSRIFWAVAEGAVAIALLTAGGLVALQTMSILIALPFSIVMILMCFATYKELHAERQAVLRVQRRRQREELTEHVSQSLIKEGLIDEPEPDGAGGTSTSGTATATLTRESTEPRDRLDD
ncbi:MAG: BCCT family transporter [Streptosporangiales bacterium]|nr:BCCT family transporter [Streptosporangiales bacterium]